MRASRPVSASEWETAARGAGALAMRSAIIVRSPPAKTYRSVGFAEFVVYSSGDRRDVRSEEIIPHAVSERLHRRRAGAMSGRRTRMCGSAGRSRRARVRADERRHSAEVQGRSREADDRPRSEARWRHAAARLELRPARGRHHAAGHVLRGRRHGALRQDVFPARILGARQVSGRRRRPRHQRVVDRHREVRRAFCRPRAGGDGHRLSELRLQRQRLRRPPAARGRRHDRRSPGDREDRAAAPQAHQPEQRARGVGLPRGHLVSAGRARRRSGSHRHLGLEQRRRRRDGGRRRRCARQGGGRAGRHAAPRPAGGP